jgi:hypothetical protein
LKGNGPGSEAFERTLARPDETEMSHTASQKIPPSASPSEGSPQFPWPLKPGRAYHVEVCRWFHPSTERRNAWYWLYEIAIGVERSESFRRIVGLSFRAMRRREDVTTKCRSYTEIVADFGDLVLSEFEWRGKTPPPRLTEFFAEIVEKVRRRAQRHEAAYDRAAESGGDW